MAVGRPTLLVYTCVTGGYDALPVPAVQPPGIEFVCLTDGTLEVPSPWQARPLPRLPGLSPPLLNRYAKMHPHVLFPDHAVSLYVDGNIQVVSDPTAFADAALAGHDMALYRHPFRDCAYDEARACADIGHDWVWRLQRQMSRYRRAGFPAHHGLFEAGVIARRHAATAVQALMSAWWNEYRLGVHRDQLSLPYLAWRDDVLIRDLGPSDPRFGRTVFSLGPPHRVELPPAARRRGRVNRFLQRHFVRFLEPRDNRS
jgi:hypothetical protein